MEEKLRKIFEQLTEQNKKHNDNACKRNASCTAK